MKSFTLVIACGWLLIAGCGRTPSPSPVSAAPATAEERPSSAAPLRPITIGLNWFPEAEHGGFYAAVVHGYFAEEGLEAEILPGGKQSPVIQQTATGQIDFAVDNADKLLLARAQQADVVAVMAPIQTSPRCLLTHAEAGVSTFEDLTRVEGLTLAMNPGQPFAQYLQHRLPLGGVPMEPYPGNISRFLLDKKFVQQAYSFSEPFLARQQGATPKLLMLADLGFNTYTSVLLTRGENIRQEPDLVARVVRASLRGWQKYLQEPEPTNTLIQQLNPQMAAEVLAYGVEDLRPLCLPDGMPPAQLGQMTDERWSTLVAQMEAAGSLPKGQVLAAGCYALEFLTAAKPMP
jgi:NitT/TauT family transport system substrate-binding protein